MFQFIKQIRVYLIKYVNLLNDQYVIPLLLQLLILTSSMKKYTLNSAYTTGVLLLHCCHDSCAHVYIWVVLAPLHAQLSRTTLLAQSNCLTGLQSVWVYMHRRVLHCTCSTTLWLCIVYSSVWILLVYCQPQSIVITNDPACVFLTVSCDMGKQRCHTLEWAADQGILQQNCLFHDKRPRRVCIVLYVCEVMEIRSAGGSECL